MMAVRVGTSRSEEGGTLHGVKQVRPHEEYDDSADVDTRDIALILLDNAISFNDRAQKVRLPILAPEEGAKGWVTGYGVQIQSAARSQPKNQLMAVELPVVNLESCKEKLKAYGGTIAEDMFCAGNLKGHKDACRGDSGGPFQIDGILYGAVAWGIGCGQEGLPGVYSDLHFFRGWLQRTSRKLLRGYKFPDPTNMPYFHTWLFCELIKITWFLSVSYCNKNQLPIMQKKNCDKNHKLHQSRRKWLKSLLLKSCGF